MSLLRALWRMPLPAHQLRCAVTLQGRDPARNGTPHRQTCARAGDPGTSVAALELPQPHPHAGAARAGLLLGVLPAQLARCAPGRELSHQVIDGATNTIVTAVTVGDFP